MSEKTLLSSQLRTKHQGPDHVSGLQPGRGQNRQEGSVRVLRSHGEQSMIEVALTTASGNCMAMLRLSSEGCNDSLDRPPAMMPREPAGRKQSSLRKHQQELLRRLPYEAMDRFTSSYPRLLKPQRSLTVAHKATEATAAGCSGRKRSDQAWRKRLPTPNGHTHSG